MARWIDPNPPLSGAPCGALAAEMLIVSDFACILDHCLSAREAGQGSLPQQLGLSGAEIARLRDRWLPAVTLPDLDLPAPPCTPEQQSIRQLILMRARAGGDEARWLAAILARRAQEQSHLWEDLGLPKRADLTALIARHLPGLAAANSANMRWKKFFYRQICSDAAFSLCLSPSCDACDEREDCFAPD